MSVGYFPKKLIVQATGYCFKRLLSKKIDGPGFSLKRKKIFIRILFIWAVKKLYKDLGIYIYSTEAGDWLKLIYICN